MALTLSFPSSFSLSSDLSARRNNSLFFSFLSGFPLFGIASLLLLFHSLNSFSVFLPSFLSFYLSLSLFFFIRLHSAREETIHCEYSTPTRSISKSRERTIRGRIDSFRHGHLKNEDSGCQSHLALAQNPKRT